MSDSENYFSDSDNEQVDEQELNTPNSDEESEYEMDEETRRLIFEHANNSVSYCQDIDDVPITKKKKSKKRVKKNKNTNMSLQDFLQQEQEKLDSKKSKKWTSKRLNDKKDKLGLSKEKVVRRRFNPRLPPPNFMTFKKKEESNKSVDISSISFPTLGSTDTSKNLVI